MRLQYSVHRSTISLYFHLQRVALFHPVHDSPKVLDRQVQGEWGAVQRGSFVGGHSSSE